MALAGTVLAQSEPLRAVDVAPFAEQLAGASELLDELAFDRLSPFLAVLNTLREWLQ